MNAPTPLSDLFLRHVDDVTRAALSAIPELEAELAQLWARASEPWPEIGLSVEQFFAFAARRVEASSLPSLQSARVDDIFLLAGYAGGDRAAAQLFESRYMTRVEIALRRIRATPDMIADVKQALRQRVLLDRTIDPDRKHYAGVGDLAAWLCVSAVREVGHMRDKHGREESLEGHALDNLPSQDENQELAYLKKLYRHEFKEAFAEALDALDVRDRNVLRYQILKGLNIEKIGLIYGVHRATVARWIAAAREKLLIGTREGLLRRVRAEDVDLESIFRLIDSELDVSLRRRLGEAP
jgi:RNA polymerase sigma-70 factor (ECF subfamily)